MQNLVLFQAVKGNQTKIKALHNWFKSYSQGINTGSNPVGTTISHFEVFGRGWARAFDRKKKGFGPPAEGSSQ